MVARRRKGNQADPPIRAVVFDVDGTLIDSVELHAAAWQQAFAHFDREVSFEAVRQQIGKGSDQLMPMFLYPEELERFGGALLDYRSKLFQKRFMPHVRPIAHVRELLSRLRLDHIQVALASSATEDELERYVELLDIAGMYQAATSSGDAARSKPYPDIIEAALDRVGWPDPRTAVMVGDTPYDAMAAEALRVETFGVLTGGFGATALREGGASKIFRDIGELLERYPFAGRIPPRNAQ